MPLSKPARKAFHENEHPQMKESTSWASSVTFVALCVYSMANVGCGAYSVPNRVAPVADLRISGSISPATNGAGVTVTLGGDANATTTTDSAGNYSFNGLPAGSYTLTPSKTGLSFTPSSRQVMADTSVAGTNFTSSSSIQQSAPIVISGQNNTVIQGLKISTTHGDCVKISNSTNITIQNSEIGPCAGNGIKIVGGSGIKILDSYIHPETMSPICCDLNDGILAIMATQSLWIQGNVIAYGESNVEIQGGSAVTVIGNFLLNPRGPSPRGQNFQCWSNCSNVTVENNYALSSSDVTKYLYPEATVDSISFGVSNGFIVQDNFVTGGHSVSGCGILADSFSNGGQILNNLLLDTGQCGIGIVDGSHVVQQNKVYNQTPVSGSGNTAIFAAHYGHSNVCGPITVTDNVADEVKPNGTHSGWWDPGTCGPIDISSDKFGLSADSVLGAPATFSAPLIPPQPKNCVVISPYSTQTSAVLCTP